MATKAHLQTTLGRKRPRLEPNDYKIALFCVLDAEVAALRGMLDEIHDDIPVNHGQNTYIFGQLSGHNVVIAVLPEPGNNDSGVVAARLRNDFPSIQYGLLIGVGGGVPSDVNDIHLGDVVIGEATSTSQAVIQFDRGKLHSNNEFKVTGYLNKPPRLLCATIKKLKAQHQQDGSQLTLLIEDMSRRHFDMRDTYSHPGPWQDQLFDSNYEHVGGGTCQQCDKHMLITRPVRSISQPTCRVHYGTIGSSNSVIRSAQERDRLARAHNVLCVEMEAAGLIHQLPCLVIRGVCDYADSHKNKQWQPYAAAAAAAYSKELLRAIPPEDLNQRSSAHKISAIQDRPPADLNSIYLPQMDKAKADKGYNDLMKSLAFRRMDARLLNVSTALPQTCKWLASHPVFSEWNDTSKVNLHHGFLWIKGKPGSGKSTLMKTLLTSEMKENPRQTTISYFFNARATSDLEKSSLGLCRSLTYQLVTACSALRPLFIERFGTKTSDGLTDEWTANELREFLLEVLSCHLDKPLVVLVDALDEGAKSDVRQLVSFLEDLASTAFESNQRLKICLSSRHFPFISIRHSVSLTVESESGQSRDIKKYIEQKLVDDGSPGMQELRDTIYEKSAGVFLWIVLVVPILNEAYDYGDQLNAVSMSRCLVSIPKELDGLFGNILAQSLEDLKECLATLQWVLFSRVPLSLDQLYTGVGLVSPSPKFNSTNTSHERIRRCILGASRGLIEVSEADPPTVQFIHETVRGFLMDKGLAQIDTTLSDNAEGLSNETLKKCCFSYVVRHAAGLMDAPGVYTEFTARRTKILSKAPLLEYATKFMFHHANAAERCGISQKQFLTCEVNACLGKWIHARNLFQPDHVKGYRPDVPLLYIMAEQGHGNLLAVLLKDGHRDQESGEKYGSALQAACVRQSEQEVRDLIAFKNDVNLGTGKYGNALFAAIQLRSQPLVDLLLRSGCKPSENMLGLQMLRCVSERNLMGVKALLDVGCPLNRAIRRREDLPPSAWNRRVKSPLWLASFGGHFEIVKVLLQAGADVNSQNGYYGTALQAASRSGSLEVVHALLQAGANVNAYDSDYGTALGVASKSGSLEVVKALLQAVADVRGRAGFYGTALDAARARSDNSRDSIVELLIEHGAV